MAEKKPLPPLRVEAIEQRHEFDSTVGKEFVVRKGTHGIVISFVDSSMTVAWDEAITLCEASDEGLDLYHLGSWEETGVEPESVRFLAPGKKAIRVVAARTHGANDGCTAILVVAGTRGTVLNYAHDRLTVAWDKVFVCDHQQDEHDPDTDRGVFDGWEETDVALDSIRLA